MFEFLKVASKSSLGVFFYFGCVCVVAATTGFFAFNSRSTAITQQLVYPLFSLGATLIAFAAYRERETNLRPRPRKPDPADYKVEVTSPPHGANVAPNGIITITGKVKRPPEIDSLELWCLMAGNAPKLRPKRIYPGPDKKWKFDYKPGGYEQRDRYTFKFYVVGQNGQALFKAYIEAAWRRAKTPPCESILMTCTCALSTLSPRTNSMLRASPKCSQQDFIRRGRPTSAFDRPMKEAANR